MGKYDVSPALQELLDTTSYDKPGDPHSKAAEAAADDDGEDETEPKPAPTPAK